MFATLAERSKVNQDRLWLQKVIVPLGQTYQISIMTLASTDTENHAFKFYPP